MNNIRILVVDDEKTMQAALREVLSRSGYHVETADDGRRALKMLSEQTFSIVITDVRMPEMDGMSLLKRIGTHHPGIAVIIMTAYGAIEDAVEAMKHGACEYLLKPFSAESVEKVVESIVRNHTASESRIDNTNVIPVPRNAHPNEPVMIAKETSMLTLMNMALEIADTKATVLIQGESGVGKEVFARFIHRRSSRRTQPFIAVNCAALPEGLLESELFGFERGAFTGALVSRKGKFELAHNGTILLDEIGEMPLSLQAKLLRVLQDFSIDPIGSKAPVKLDLRVIATTNKALENELAAGRFRTDLFYRLNVMTFTIPPLKERRKDLLPLAEYFVQKHCRINNKKPKTLGDDVISYLYRMPWEGNVRELENFIERAVLLSRQDVMTLDGIFISDSLEVAFGNKEKGTMLPERDITLEEMEKKLILNTLDRVNGNRTQAAQILGVSVRTIRNKLNQYGLKEPTRAAAEE